MNVRRLQGLALIVSAVCLLFGLFGPQSISVIGPQATTFFLIVGGILYILGIPAVNSAQPTGWLGLTGIMLLILAALIPLLFRLDMVPSVLADSLSLTSALAGLLGAVIIGWITIREHVFPAWVGWAFMAQSLLNFISGQFNPGFLKGMIPIFVPVLDVVAIFAYGYFIYQQSVKPTIASEAKVP
ncbi:MAG: hypothetical protein ABIU06_15545, partial [Anaerolineales bacterium]